LASQRVPNGAAGNIISRAGAGAVLMKLISINELDDDDQKT
jgi:hypothetical protein